MGKEGQGKKPFDKGVGERVCGLYGGNRVRSTPSNSRVIFGGSLEEGKEHMWAAGTL